jgi:hypothetical protein
MAAAGGRACGLPPGRSGRRAQLGLPARARRVLRGVALDHRRRAARRRSRALHARLGRGGARSARTRPGGVRRGVRPPSGGAHGRRRALRRLAGGAAVAAAGECARRRRRRAHAGRARGPRGRLRRRGAPPRPGQRRRVGGALSGGRRRGRPVARPRRLRAGGPRGRGLRDAERRDRGRRAPGGGGRARSVLDRRARGRGGAGTAPRGRGAPAPERSRHPGARGAVLLGDGGRAPP